MRPFFGVFLLVAGLLGIALASEANERPRLRAQKQSNPVTQTVQNPPQTVGGVFDGSLRKKLLLSIVKHRTLAKLQKDGLNGKKLTRAEAEAAYEKLTEDVILGAVAEASEPVAGQIVGGPLTNFLDWLANHGDEIMRIVDLILKILALFGG
jgi:hypothetical protein